MPRQREPRPLWYVLHKPTKLGRRGPWALMLDGYPRATISQRFDSLARAQAAADQLNDRHAARQQRG